MQQEMKRSLNDYLQRYSREFRRRNPEVKEQVALVRSAVSYANDIDAAFVRGHQLVHLLLHGCYTKQVPIVTASLQAFHFLVQQCLLVSADLQLVVQVLSELTDSGMRLPEIGATALQCCFSDDSLVGSSLAKALSVCLRQRVQIWEMHRVISVVIDRTSETEDCEVDDDACSLLSVASDAPPPVHSMDTILADAFGLLQDMVSLAGPRRRLHWLYRVRQAPLILTLDLLAHTLTQHPTLFIRNRFFEKLLRRRVMSIVATLLEKHLSGEEHAASDATSVPDSSSSSSTCSSGSDTPTGEEEDNGPGSQPEELFLRIVVVSERLVRHFAPVDRLRSPCSQLLELMLRGLTTSNRHQKAMILRAWSGLLSSCVASWTDLDAVDEVLFPNYLTEIIQWLCRELNSCLRAANVRRDSVDTSPPPEDTVVAFRMGTMEVAIRDVAMKTEVSWESPTQEVTFDAAEYLYIVLFTTKSVVVSLNARMSETVSSERLLPLVRKTCSELVGILGEMVRRCVDRRTDQTLILALETILELAGRAGHPEVCSAVVQIHTSLIHRCLSLLHTVVNSGTTDGPPRESAADISLRVAQFGVGLLHLVSSFASYIEDSWVDVVDVTFRLMRLFDFPFFKSVLLLDYRPTLELTNSAMTSMVSLVCEETTDVRRDLELELNAFFSKSLFYPHSVLRRILHALFSTMLDKIGERRITLESQEEFDARLHFTIAKVSELAIYNLERFHTFGAEWFSDFVGLFFVTLTVDVRPARQCFMDVVNRLLEMETENTVVEEALVGAFYHFELTDRPELMRLQIGCLHRLADRYKTTLPLHPHSKSLVSIPDLLRRHCILPDRENIAAAFQVFKDFALSPGLISDLEVCRQCCERCLHLGVAFMSQRLCFTTASAAPQTLRLVYQVMRNANLDVLEAMLPVLLNHIARLETFARDDRAEVRQNASHLLFDVLIGQELRSTPGAFAKLVSKVLLPGLRVVLAELSVDKDEDTVRDHAGYIANAQWLLLVRCVQQRVRLEGQVWAEVVELIKAGTRAQQQIAAFAALLSLQNFARGVAGEAAGKGDGGGDGETMKMVRRRLWRLSVEMANLAVEGEIREELLADTLILLQDNFLAEFDSLSRKEKEEVVQLVVGLIHHHGDIEDRKERCLLSLVETVSNALFDSGDEEDEADACTMLHLVANLPFEDEEKVWPADHLQPHQCQAFVLLREVASRRVEMGVKQSMWLARCLNACKLAATNQYLCTNLSTWKAAHACIGFAVDALSRPRLAIGTPEKQRELVRVYEATLLRYLFMENKDSRHVTAADFLEHQKMELEILAKVRDFIAARPIQDDRGTLRSRITHSFLLQLSTMHNTTDILLSPSNTGPSLAGEFCDSRQWRFHAACIETLVTLVNWWLELPESVVTNDDMDVLLMFKNYAINVFVRFKERLEVRGVEPLPSVLYFEVSAILKTLKTMIASSQSDSRRRKCVVELYPCLVDVILYCNGSVLASIIEVLHTYKAIMQPRDT